LTSIVEKVRRSTDEPSKMDAKETALMEKLWSEKSKNGIVPSYQMAMILPQIRKNLEVDDEELENMITELDKAENGTLSKECYEKLILHFLTPKA